MKEQPAKEKKPKKLEPKKISVKGDQEQQVRYKSKKFQKGTLEPGNFQVLKESASHCKCDWKKVSVRVYKLTGLKIRPKSLCRTFKEITGKYKNIMFRKVFDSEEDKTIMRSV